MSKADAAPRYVPFRNQVFTVPEAAAHLRVSRVTVYSLINSGQLKPIKIGSRTLILGRALERCLTSLTA